MRPYEVMIILDAQLEDDVIRTATDRAVDMIRNGGAENVRVERWGRRRFAYELKHRWEGYYALLECTAEPAAMVALDRQLRLTDGVLRHKVIRVPDHIAGRERRTLTVPDASDADTRAEA